MCDTSIPIRTYAELRRLGFGRTRIREEVRAGSAIPLRRGVYARPTACTAARDAASHGGAIACDTAARHLGLWVLDEDAETVHVWMRRGGHRYVHVEDQEGCSCVEHWDDGPYTDAFGLPSVRRVLRQILLCHDVEHFFVALESALRQRLLTSSDLSWLRRHTNAIAREAIGLARRDADSGLESLLRWRLRAHRLRIRTQVQVHATARVDLLIGDLLIVEADGKGNHEDDEHRHKDLVRDAKSSREGYVTLRFDYALIVHDWNLVEAAILGHVRAGHHLARRVRR